MENKLDLRIQILFSGNLEDIPEQNTALIRLFLSTTTKDVYY